MIQGLKESKLSHLDMSQLKAEFNRTLFKLGLPGGNFYSVVNMQNGGTVVEADSDEAAIWLSNSMN
jgi:hypothetical protein